MNEFVLFNGVDEPIYDASNIHEFSGTVNQSDLGFLYLLDRILRVYIQDPDTPDLTAN